MILSKKALEQIKKIIERNYHSLLVSTVGRKVLTDEEIKALEAAGVDTTNETSLLSLIYFNNILNDLGSPSAPTSISDMLAQQKQKPAGMVHTAAEEHLNENFAQAVEKIKSSIQAGIEGIAREYNLVHRNESMQGSDRQDDLAALVRESTVGGLKQKIRDWSHDGSRDWQRVAITETSNALGLGSVDRIAKMNEDKDYSNVYVYRIPVNDAALCKFCRKFYLDSDSTPAIYRLSTILSNGTNFGKKTADWKAVAVATHPNERCSGIMELRPGWKVLADGRLEFIGQDAWKDYVRSKLRE